MISRRTFLLGTGGAVLPVLATRAGAPAAGSLAQLPEGRVNDLDTTNLFVMDQSAALAVRLPPKPAARASMTTEGRDALEARLRCPCGCTHDLLTCRTTDLECAVAPRLHEDIDSLVAGGYDAREIEAEFVRVFGDGIRVVPRAEGFNLLGWLVPYAGYAAAAAIVGHAVRRMRDRTADVETSP